MDFLIWSERDRPCPLAVVPIVGIGIVIGAEADDVAIRGAAEAQHSAVGVREVGGDLVDLQNLAVAPT